MKQVAKQNESVRAKKSHNHNIYIYIYTERQVVAKICVKNMPHMLYCSIVVIVLNNIVPTDVNAESVNDSSGNGHKSL